MTKIAYRSTRGTGPSIGFDDALLAGPAPDGGLYLPDRWPDLPTTSGTYTQVAAAVMWPFVADSLGRAEFESIVASTYESFDHRDVCPLVELDAGHHLLELFHGPTLAFKDVALQLVGRLFDRELQRRDATATIVGATSGDTGSAAMEAVRDRQRIDIVMLHPAGRTSEIQRRQMTTLDAPNVHAVAVDGTFDDCQDLVKAMFADTEFRDKCALAAVNSINWARVMAQVVYYVWAQHQIGHRVTFTVPTGNFGNVFAGHVARRCGLDIDRFLVASNTNDILSRLIETGRLERHDVVATLSPSMDIQISSNLERLVFELFDQDGAATATWIEGFRSTGRAALEPHQHDRLVAEFAGDRLDDTETTAVMSETYRRHGLLVDPHTAVGLGVTERLRRTGETVVTLATAHPAKFPDAVEAATGIRPQPPDRLADIHTRPERMIRVANDLREVQAVVERARR